MFLARPLGLLALVPLIQLEAAAQDIVVHYPYSIASGPASDTLYRNAGGTPTWQREADDFLLGASAVVRRAGWWGFYGGTFGQGSPNPPLGDELMRVRLYGSRLTDGLPDESNILYDETFLNPSRTWTGGMVGNQRQFYFEVDLASTVSLLADTPYWFEVAQIGDIDSLFRWEFSAVQQDGRAFISNTFPDWTYVAGADLAFQLSAVPEPATAALVTIGFMVCGMLPNRRGRCR